MVRSKSEMMIADILYDAGIRYKTDSLLEIDGVRNYPDFQMLRPHDNALVIWEHFGLTNRPDYVAGSYKKILGYGRAGFVPGRTMIITYESDKDPLTRKEIVAMLGSCGLFDAG